MTSARGIPADSNYLFPVPLVPEDIFQVGPTFTDRWFRGNVGVPGGLWAWVDRQHFRPHVNKLVQMLVISGNTKATLAIRRGHYVLDGLAKPRVPRKTALITCRPISLLAALRGLQRQVSGNEMEVLRWLEYFQSQNPQAFETALKSVPKLQQLMR